MEQHVPLSPLSALSWRRQAESVLLVAHGGIF